MIFVTVSLDLSAGISGHAEFSAAAISEIIHRPCLLVLQLGAHSLVF
jgi:hypothetical protein